MDLDEEYQHIDEIQREWQIDDMVSQMSWENAQWFMCQVVRLVDTGLTRREAKFAAVDEWLEVLSEKYK